MTEPDTRVPVTATWKAPGCLARIRALTSSNVWYEKENFRLREEAKELKARLAAVREIFEYRDHEALSRRVVRIVDGHEPLARQGRHVSGHGAGGDVGGDVGVTGVGGPPPAGSGVAGGGSVPAGSGDPADDSGGDGGVPGAVGSVVVWPYEQSGVA